MITEPTVLILGAGASMPYGFPSGQQLLYRISKNIRGESSNTYQTLRSIYSDASFIKTFGRLLIDSQQASVDAFLSSESRENFWDIGKAAIAVELLQCENPKSIQRTEIDEEKGKWYASLFRSFGSTRDDFFISRENLSIITFNYDRSLEYFLYSAIKSFHNWDDELIFEYIKEFPIIHIYGSLGPPDLWAPDYGVPYIGFPNQTALLGYTRKAVPNIQILPEVYSSSRKLNNAIDLIHNARTICFLGFGYHKQNIELLFKGHDYLRQRLVCGSTFKTGEAKRKEIKNYFYSLHQSGLLDLGTDDEDCYTFLREHYVLK